VKESLANFLDFALETAFLAGRTVLGRFQTGAEVGFKQDDTPVTEADREAERLIRGRIEKAFPRHAIVGEEFGAAGADGASHRWYIDPIDGTKSFARGVPLFAVLLGLEIEGRLEVGAAYFPALDEMIAAASGLGCRWNGRPARVSATEALSRATVAHGDVAAFARRGRGSAWARLQDATYYRAGWCDAYGYLLAATGRVDVMIEPVIAPWDCAPFPPIFREAGGYFGNWRGEETIHGDEALACSRLLAPQVLATLRGDASR